MLHRLVLVVALLIITNVIAGCGSPQRVSPETVAAAEAGDAAAQFQMGVAYDNGYGVRRDLTEAAKWYERAAEQGHAAAQTSLGSLYENGEGVPQDYSRAIELYRKAAAQGEPMAQHSLGFMYDQGMGVAEDDNEAARLYRAAAEKGLARAQLNLGLMYIDGTGVPQDRRTGMEWLHKARTNPTDKQAQWAARAALERLGWSWTEPGNLYPPAPEQAAD